MSFHIVEWCNPQYAAGQVTIQSIVTAVLDISPWYKVNKPTMNDTLGISADFEHLIHRPCPYIPLYQLQIRFYINFCKKVSVEKQTVSFKKYASILVIMQ